MNDSKLMTRQCSERFEKDAREAETHTCKLPADHAEGKHVCPRCGVEWTVQ